MATWKLVVSAALLAGAASAAEPAKVQDPPGDVDVDQPAGVSLPDRNTDQDVTDTLRGGSTEVIDGERVPSDVRASESWRNVQPGTEARASFEGGTGSGAAPADDPATGASDAPADEAESSVLGADAGGYGRGPAPAPAL